MTRLVSVSKWIAISALGALAAIVAAAEADEAPGAGFFERLVAELDADGDGVITREEFDQGTSRFPRLDSNEDGVLTEEDFADGPPFGWHRGGGRGGGPKFGGPRFGGPGPRGPRGSMLLSHVADPDRDGMVAAHEWQALLDALDEDADGVVSLDSLEAVLPEPPDRGHRGRGPGGMDRGSMLSIVLDRDGDDVLEISDLEEIFAELDANGDGALEADELPRFRHRGRGPRGGS